MKEVVAKYNPPLSHEEGQLLPSLALLSKRKARAILRIGNDTLNSLIKNGDIKIILINKKEKIPYVSLQDYVNTKLSEVEDIPPKYEKNYGMEESIKDASKIINNILRGKI